MGKISTSPRYVIDITRMHPLSLGDMWGGEGRKLILKNLQNEVFLTYKGVIVS